jgi:hypothetical protein
MAYAGFGKPYKSRCGWGRWHTIVPVTCTCGQTTKLVKNYTGVLPGGFRCICGDMLPFPSHPDRLR